MRRIGCRRSFIAKNAEPSTASIVDKVQPSIHNPLIQLPSANQYQPGQTYDGFYCESAEYIPDFNMAAYQFHHERLLTKYLHIDRNDPNNVFSINFRTTPFDSTGIPHILEHSVLCGSERYPVRDPFFKMINRSMATFMNAMTGPDYTLYPFSSMNETDFRNLQRVYLDAVFRPNLNYLDFLQEGWRLENSDLMDEKSPHTIKGVVYNEMKGAFSENSNIFSTKFLTEILPSHTYGHCSGGDPLHIPNLTHEQLVAFHRKYYHPCNARFFSYGNFALGPTLKYINETYLQQYDKIPTEFSRVPLEPRWSTPKRQHIVSRLDSMGSPAEQQNQIAIGFLMSDITDIYETLVLSVLSELLIKGPNSPFYQSLIEPNISGGYSQMTGFESSIRDTMFVVGLQDVRVADFDKVESLVAQTIDTVIKSGFEADHVASVLNSIELGLKHQSPKFGLGLLFNVTPIWNHDGNIGQTVQYSIQLAKLRKNLANQPDYLQQKVAHYFKKGQHKLVMTMSPDAEYEQKFTQAEQMIIADKSTSLDDKQRKRVFEHGKALAENQKSPQDLNLLPCLTLQQVEKAPAINYTLEQSEVLGIPTQICTVDTNNVSYFQALFNGNGLTMRQKLLLPLLANIADQMGTTRRDYRQFDKDVTASTAGMNFGLHVNDDVRDLTRYTVGLSLGSYCLAQNITNMFEMCHELLTAFSFDDVPRFEMLLKNYASALSVGIANSGHVYAMQSAGALVSEAGQLRGQLTGIEHIDFVRTLTDGSTPAVELLAELRELATKLFGQSSFRCALNTSATTRDRLTAEHRVFVDRMRKTNQQTKPFEWLESKALHGTTNLHTVMNIPVNYCAKALQTVPFSHADFPALRVLGKVLTSKYLLPVVREQNGAYGAGAKIGMDGLFSFYSYRDPNAQKTLDTFDASAGWVKENWSKIDEQLLFEAKLGVLQQLDEPTAPGSKGMRLFNYGIDDAMYQAHRSEVLRVSREDLDRVTKRYLSDGGAVTAFGRFVLGPENKTFASSSEWKVKQQQQG